MSSPPTIPRTDEVNFDRVFNADQEHKDILAVDVVVIYAIYNEKDPMSLFGPSPSVPLSCIVKDKASSSAKDKTLGSARDKQETIQQEFGNKNQREGGGTPVPKYRNWVTDENMLRSALPAVGILTCGFKLVSNVPANLQLRASQIRDEVKSWRGQRQRPIIWICHGYGSMLIPPLFELGNSASELLSSTAAILLFLAPIDPNSACSLRKWTCNELRMSQDEEPFKISPTSSQDGVPTWLSLRTQARNHDMALLSVINVEHQEPAQGQGEIKQRAIQPKSDDAKQKEKANVPGDPENTPGTQNTKPKDQKGISFDHVFEKKGNFGDTAKFLGREDRTFVGICNELHKAVQTHQILSAARPKPNRDISTLIERGVSVRLCNNRGESALHLACRFCKPDLVKYLVRASQIDLGQRDQNGMTALHIAAQTLDKHGPDIVKVLLEAGANWAVHDGNNKTPLDIANDNKDNQPAGKAAINREIIKWLENPPPVRREFANRKMAIAAREDDLKRTCVNTRMSVRELNFAEGRDMVRLDEFTNIEDVIYGDLPVGKIIEKCFSNRRSEDYEKNPVCRWFHIPSNNMAWVHDLFVRLGIKKWPWPQGFRDYGRPQSRCVYPHCGSFTNPGGTDEPVVQAIMIPYIAFGDNENQDFAQRVMDAVMARDGRDHRLSVSGRHHYLRRRREARRRKFDSIDAMSSPLFRKIVNCLVNSEAWSRTQRRAFDEDDQDIILQIAASRHFRYLIYTHPTSREDLPLHPRRSLDQSYYYMLQDTSYRDRSQVYSRWASGKRMSNQQYRQQTSLLSEILLTFESFSDFDESHDSDDSDDFEDLYGLGETKSRRVNGDILMVDQLWLWRIPGDEPGDADTLITSFPDQDELHRSDERILNDLNQSICTSTDDLVKLILNGCCQTLGKGHREGSLNAMEAFENAVGNAEEQEAQLFQSFKTLSGLLSDLGERDPLYHHFQKLFLGYLDILKETHLLTEVKDILDEIKMIEQVLGSQAEVLSQPDWGLEYQVLGPLRRVQDSFKNMKARAQAVEKAIERLLDLKQKQANTWEARIAREGAAETARQGSNLFWFTIVTIIFLPLSFMATFFALDVDQFPQNPESQETSWPLNLVCGLIFGVSFAISVPLILVVLNKDGVGNAMRKGFRMIRYLGRMIGYLWWDLWWDLGWYRVRDVLRTYVGALSVILDKVDEAR